MDEYTMDEYTVAEYLYELRRKELEAVFSEVLKGQTVQQWPYLSEERVQKIWVTFAEKHLVLDEKGMDDIAQQAIRCVMRLYVNTLFAGHVDAREYDAEVEELCEVFKVSKRKRNKIEKQMEGYVHCVSDYGVEPLFADCVELLKCSTAEQKLVVVDRMFQRSHMSGDLTEIFFKSGTKFYATLSCVS